VTVAPARGESLESTIHAAFLQHPSIESAKAALDAANAERREHYSGYFPTLSASTTAGRIYGDNSTSRGLSVTRGAGYSGLWEGQVTARQPIFDGFETQNRVAAAEARKQSADMSLADVRESLALRSAQAYINLMRARQGLAMLKEQGDSVADYLGRIKGAVDSGTSDEAEHQQARDVSTILDGFIADYEAQVRAAEAEYMAITGRFPEGVLDAPATPLGRLPENIDEAIAAALAEHPSLKAAEFTSASSQHEIGSEKAQLYPDLDGELSYYKADKEDLIGGESIDARAVMRMSWEFDTGGAQLARIKKKKYEHQEALARRNELNRQIEQGVRLAYSDLESARLQVANSDTRIELNEKLFETYKVQFEGARITLLQLMQSDNQLFNTKLERMNAGYRLLAAQYAALASMGRLQNSLTLAASSPEAKPHEQQ
jgi:adhesin transport system outer membrane protein